MIPTKYVITDNQLEIISKHFPKVWIFIAITGLNETKLFSLNDYLESYAKMCSKLDNVVCAVRPIVKGENDNMVTIAPILEAVKQGNKLLTYTGFRDPSLPGSEKYVDEALFDQIENYCMHNEIVVEQKCACIVARVTKQKCHIHNDGLPTNLDLIQALGYEIELESDRINILGFRGNGEITKGDYAFIQMITRSTPKKREYEFSEILSIRLESDLRLVCTSSWFQWANQIACRVGCWYCFADFKSDVRINLPHFGCNPKDILTIL